METRRMKDYDEAIRSALTSVKTATTIPVTMYGQILQDRRVKITHWIGLRTAALHNLVIKPGTGIAGLVAATGRPVGVSDYVNASSITHEYDDAVQEERLYSVVAVPVIVQRVVRGVLYVGVHSPIRLGNKVLEEVTMAARSLEQDFAVNDALRRMGTVEPRRNAGQALNGAQWEQIRSAHSKLRMLTNRVDDEELRRDLESLCDQMVQPVALQPATKLSARELDVLACVALGHTNVEAAEEMGIGSETVKSYLRSVMRKLGAHTRYEAVNAARRIGMLP